MNLHVQFRMRGYQLGGHLDVPKHNRCGLVASRLESPKFRGDFTDAAKSERLVRTMINDKAVTHSHAHSEAEAAAKPATCFVI
jgi:hypothetical protein